MNFVTLEHIFLLRIYFDNQVHVSEILVFNKLKYY
jgi:hypothetical protein